MAEAHNERRSTKDGKTNYLPRGRRFQKISIPGVMCTAILQFLGKLFFFLSSALSSAKGENTNYASLHLPNPSGAPKLGI